MSKLLSSVTGGGGGSFTSKFVSGGIIINAATTGTLFTLTPPAGQKVKLSQILGAAATTSLVTISVGGSAVVAALPLINDGADGMAGGAFGVGGNAGGPPIVGEYGEVIEATTNVTTSHVIYYAYEFGV